MLSSSIERLVSPQSFTYLVGAGISIPILNWQANRYHVAAAWAEVRAREALLAQQRRDAEADLIQSQSNLLRARRQLSANTQALATAERAVRLTKELYTKGIITYLELLNAAQNLIGIQQQQASLYGSYYSYWLNNQLARGGR